jgi:septum formation protein
LENQVIGKPEDAAQAVEILRRLSGRAHKVITGVCLSKGDKMTTFSEVTRVFFRELTEEQITYYVRHFLPLDKAGAYAIQEWIGLIGVERIEGDYFNVVGLPVGRVIREMECF